MGLTVNTIYHEELHRQHLHTKSGSELQKYVSHAANDIASQRVWSCHSTNAGEPTICINARTSSDHDNSSEPELDSSFGEQDRETIASIRNEGEDSEGLSSSSQEGDEELSEVEDEENTSSEEEDNVSSSADGTNSVSSGTSVNICLVCLKGGNVVTCAACGLPVHRRCYGSNLFPQNVVQWFCEICCKTGENNTDGNPPFCVLCPVRGGAMRVTDVGNYFHVVCAMVHKKLLDENDALCERPNLLELASQFGQNPCVLCKDSEFASCGVSVLCDSGLCKKSMHVSCAQRAGLFVHDAEPNIFYLWCYDHRDVETSKHNKKLYKEIMQQMLNFSRHDLTTQPPNKFQRLVSKNLTFTMKNSVEIPATAFAEFITLDHRKKKNHCQNEAHANQPSRKKSLARRSIELHIDGALYDRSIPVAFSEEFFYYYHARAEALKGLNEFSEKMENKCNTMQAIEKEALKRVHPAVREIVKICTLTGKDVCGGDLTTLGGNEIDRSGSRPRLLLPSISSEEEQPSERKKKRGVRSQSRSEAVSQNSRDNFVPQNKTVKALRRSPRFARRSQALPPKELSSAEESSGQVVDCSKDLPNYSHLTELKSMSPLELVSWNNSVNTVGQNYAAGPSFPEELTKSQMTLDLHVPKNAQKFEADAKECGEASCSTELCFSEMISVGTNMQEGVSSTRSSRRLKRSADESDGLLSEKSANTSIAQPTCLHESCKQPNEINPNLIADEIELRATESTEYIDEKHPQCQKSNGINFSDALSGLKHIALNLKATKSATAQLLTVNSTAAAPASPVILQESDEPVSSQLGSVLFEPQEAVRSFPTESKSLQSSEVTVRREVQNILLGGVPYDSAEQRLSPVFHHNSEYDMALLPSETKKELADCKDKRSNEDEDAGVYVVKQQLTESEEQAGDNRQKVICSESFSDSVLYLVPCEQEDVEVQLSKPEVSVEYEDVPTIGMEVYVANSESCCSTTPPPRPPSAELALPIAVSYQTERKKRATKRKKNLVQVIRVEDIE
ncbi:hypothetical protein M513_13577 [Trichuris suis]|uniref:PHD-type domain-containing protein n=2 Tax=Trichuris suis TaxID=68888 RepID=A0A085LKQ4_9BILA|nr:hypothetical protein M513_13577 [Trichuris suis]